MGAEAVNFEMSPNGGKPPRPQAEAAGGFTVVTSLRLPRSLWRDAHVAAMNEGRDLRDVMIDALTAYLKARREGR